MHNEEGEVFVRACEEQISEMYEVEEWKCILIPTIYIGDKYAILMQTLEGYVFAVVVEHEWAHLKPQGASLIMASIYHFLVRRVLGV